MDNNRLYLNIWTFLLSVHMLAYCLKSLLNNFHLMSFGEFPTLICLHGSQESPRLQSTQIIKTNCSLVMIVRSTRKEEAADNGGADPIVQLRRESGLAATAVFAAHFSVRKFRENEGSMVSSHDQVATVVRRKRMRNMTLHRLASSFLVNQTIITKL